ncbi:transposase [Sinorhizobium meliloti]|nr:hypothetical protein CN140_31870 [Sinorhizobium meliloti]
MTTAYSLDLRERIAGFVDGGRSRHAAAGHFGVSVSFVVKLMAAWRLAPKPGGGWRYSKLDPHRDFLIRRVREKDDTSCAEGSANSLGRRSWQAGSQQRLHDFAGETWLSSNQVRRQPSCLGRRTAIRRSGAEAAKFDRSWSR